MSVLSCSEAKKDNEFPLTSVQWISLEHNMYFIRAVKSLQVIERERNVTGVSVDTALCGGKPRAWRGRSRRSRAVYPGTCPLGRMRQRKLICSDFPTNGIFPGLERPREVVCGTVFHSRGYVRAPSPAARAALFSSSFIVFHNA